MGRMTAAEQRARAVLDRLPDGPVVGAEVGVFDGRMSCHLLTRPDLTLYMVDRWDAPTASYAASGDPRAMLGGPPMLEAMSKARDAVAFSGSRARMLRKDSLSAALAIERHTLDFAFIDADHSYQGVARDIDRWRHNVKPGGLLCGHDYWHPDFPGVHEAVGEAAVAHGWTVELGKDRTWFVRL